MNRRLPSRGPRVVHGMGKLVQQARALEPAQAAVLGVSPPAQLAADHAEAMRDPGVLLQRCQAAEAKVARVQDVLD